MFFGRFHLFVHFCDSRVYSPLFKCCTLQILWIAATALTFDISLSHYWTSLVVMYGKMLQGSHCWKFLFILIIMSKHVSEIVCILCSVNHSSEHPPNVTHTAACHHFCRRHHHRWSSHWSLMLSLPSPIVIMFCSIRFISFAIFPTVNKSFTQLTNQTYVADFSSTPTNSNLLYGGARR